MPVSPDGNAELTAQVIAYYLDAENRLLARIAAAIAQGLDAPGWAERQLLEVQRTRALVQAQLIAVEDALPAAMGDVLGTAANRGAAAASADIAATTGVTVTAASRTLADPRPVQALARDAVRTLTSTHTRILRSAVDIHRGVVADVVGSALLGADTRRDVAQRALDSFAEKGVTGFVDRAGRSWDLTSYTEMATRAATMNATMSGHEQRLSEGGYDLVMVNDVTQECERCRPFEGQVLALSGVVVGAIKVPHATEDGRAVKVKVLATLDEARAAGLFHPGCRHSYGAYFPGVTEPIRGTQDPQGDKDRQRLRALERQVRAAKRREQVALDDTARERARAQIKARQAAIREHVKTTSAVRQPNREQITRAR